MQRKIAKTDAISTFDPHFLGGGIAFSGNVCQISCGMVDELAPRIQVPFDYLRHEASF
jgi:hypothetical protein